MALLRPSITERDSTRFFTTFMFRRKNRRFSSWKAADSRSSPRKAWMTLMPAMISTRRWVTFPSVSWRFLALLRMRLPKKPMTPITAGATSAITSVSCQEIESSTAKPTTSPISDGNTSPKTSRSATWARPTSFITRESVSPR